MKSEKAEWTLVVAANNEMVLQNTLLQSPDIDSDCQVLVKRGFSCAGAAYNSGLAEAGAELVVFAHQDVYLPLSWKQELDSVVEVLENQNPDWGVLGVFGMTSGSQPKATGYCYSTGLQMVLGVPFNKPVRAQSLDELVLILRRSSGLRFDENLPDFHLYGGDICLQANSAGMDCYIIPAFCIHNSNGLKYLPRAYWQAYFYMRKKWWDLLPVSTCCSCISRSIKPAVAQIVSDVRTWAAKKKQVGTRCADVVSLYGDLVRTGKLDRTKRTSTEEYVSG
jgi:hypothetical protein